MAIPNSDAREIDADRVPLVTSLQIQLKVLSALMIRDLVSRYGRQNFGFLWAVLEPLILTVGVMVLWSTLKPPYQHGVHVVSLVLTGYMPLTLWRHLTQCAIYPLRRNGGLLYHRNVTLLDGVFSRLAIEFLGTTTALVFVSAVLITSGLVEPVRDCGLVILAWFTMAALAAGLGLIVGAATEYSDVMERIIQPAQYFLLPISGCFYMADWLPSRVREYALYVPMLHVYEMFRAGFFDEGTRTFFNPAYPILWSSALIATGLFLLARVRDRVGLA